MSFDTEGPLGRRSALAVAVLALLVAVAGSGAAVATHLEVRSGDIVDGQVKGPDLAANAVTGPKLDESTVGPVPESDAVRGLYGATFDKRLTSPGTRTLLQLRGLKITMSCTQDSDDTFLVLLATTSVDNARLHASFTYGGEGFGDAHTGRQLDFDTGDTLLLTPAEAGHGNLVYTSPFGRTVTVDYGYDSSSEMACYADGVAFGG